MSEEKQDLPETDLTSAEESAAVETAAAENAEVSDRAGGGNAPKKKKDKKPWTKKKKIVVGVVSGVVGAILIAIIVVASVFLTMKPAPAPFDLLDLNVEMGKDYYVGTEGDAPSVKPIVQTKIEVPGAYNVTTYEDFFQKLSEGKDVVIHGADSETPAKFTMTKALGSINLKSNIYGNGASINANEVVSGTSADETGGNAINIGNEKKVTIRDLKVYGKDNEEGDTLRTFNWYGSIVSVEGTEEKKAEADLIHCVFEKGHKVVHLIGANVYMEGCIVRNAADTAISIGTFANRATHFTSKNNVVADSLTGGILTYCYDNGVNASSDNDATWNTIDIQGFLDLYNWKKSNSLAFLPTSELKGDLARLEGSINFICQQEIIKGENADKRVDVGDMKYIHFGILKIATNEYGQNKSKILYDGKEIVSKDDNELGYATKTFPIPPIATNFIAQIYVTGYFNNDEGQVKHDSRITDNKNLYKELREGRA